MLCLTKGGSINILLDTIHTVESDIVDSKNMAAGKYLRLSVSDSGSGMNRETLSNIFDPFFTTKEKERGTGLGLSVVHGIVTGCNGSIKVKSEVGQGTTFTVIFPTVTAGIPIEPEVAVLPPSGTENILFVDDEKDLRNLTRQMLTYLGYSVVCCSSGVDALEKIKEDCSGFDLLITDQSMPGMPGTELSEKVIKLCPGLPIILCTGYSSMVDDEKARNIGIRAFLLKPLAINVLAREIRTILDN